MIAFVLFLALIGDVNNDGFRNAGDLQPLVNFVNTGLPVAGEPDCNGDGQVDIADVVFLLELINAPTPSPTASPTPTASASASASPSVTASASVSPTPSISPTISLSPTPSLTPTPEQSPPDPAAIAPPLDETVPNNLFVSSAFLYGGDNPVQRGLVNGTLKPQRVAVIRGRVLDTAGLPLAGVRITIVDHDEFGHTFSRADGQFDLVVNGGGLLVVQYQLAGHLTLQRQNQIPWQDYVQIDDVRMTALDAAANPVTFGSGAPQLALGSPETDAEGTRQAALFIPPGVGAFAVLDGGTTVPLSGGTMRATEYTVGDGGPEAMPGALPPNSGYTYCADYTIDEAEAMGARSVRFDNPIYSYVENFLGFPTGVIVPSGFYDRERGVWVASENGRVIQITAIVGGSAQVDADGDTAPDDAPALAALGFTAGELQMLGGRYTAGQSLWRVPIRHFTPFDFNWPFQFPAGADDPKQPDPFPEVDQACQTNGSSIDVQNQIFGEEISLAGSTHSLHYRSDRVPGFHAAYELPIQVTGPTLPGPIKKITVTSLIAGQFTVTDIPVLPNQSFTVVWNGKDAYGRVVHGTQPLTVFIEYIYEVVLRACVDPVTGFGSFLFGGSCPPPEILLTRKRSRSKRQTIKKSLGLFDARGQGFGGWMLNVHHAYDPQTNVIYMGDGHKHEAISFNNVITTIAGGTLNGFSGDGGPATQAKINLAYGVEIAPDGTIFIDDRDNVRIRKIDPNGIISTYAGTGAFSGPLGDGGPATEAIFPYSVDDILLGRDGSLYISNAGARRIRRVTPDGIINTICGTGVEGFSGDNGPAELAQISQVAQMALGPDGSIYLADTQNRRVRRIRTDGIIETVAGNGSGVFTGFPEGAPATAVVLQSPQGVAMAPDGILYINNSVQVFGEPFSALYRVAQDGTITSLAMPPDTRTISKLTCAPDGALYIVSTSSSNMFLWKRDPKGIYTKVAGNGQFAIFAGEGGPALQAVVNPRDVALHPDGSLVYGDGQSRLIKIAPALPGFTGAQFAVMSDDGSEVYQFDANGRHLRTLEPNVGRVMREFSYNAAGYLVSFTDADGNITLIERDANNAPKAIVAPFGARADLTVNGAGLLTGVTNPIGAPVALEYSNTEGLLTGISDPNLGKKVMTYDTAGRITSEMDPSGGLRTFTRSGPNGNFTLTYKDAEGRETVFGVAAQPDGTRTFTNTLPNLNTTQTKVNPDGSVATTQPDGSVRTITRGPDPRYGMRAPRLKELRIDTPGGLHYKSTLDATANLDNPNNPFSATSITETHTINGRVFTTQIFPQTNRLRETTPLGRSKTFDFDNSGRFKEVFVSGLDPTTYTYDAQGRLSSVRTGFGASLRSITNTYDSLGRVATQTDSLAHTTQLQYDSGGRISKKIFADGRQVAFTYNVDGNLTVLTPPGRPAHTFAYSPTGLLTLYTAPVVAGVPAPQTTYAYDADGRQNFVGFPDGRAITMSRRGDGLLERITTTEAIIEPHYTSSAGSCCGADGIMDSLIRTPPDRLTTETLQFVYDGSLQKATIWSGTVAGRVDYTFDNNFDLVTQTVNADSSITYLRDGDGLLRKVGDMTLTRDSSTGALNSTSLGSISGQFTNNTRNELLTRIAQFSGSDIYRADHVRDTMGRISQLTEIIGGITTVKNYSYDAANRLTGVLLDGQPFAAYAYDSNGNRLSHTNAPAAAINATYDNQDRLLTFGAATYTYTARGDLASRVSGGQTTTYQYDSLFNLLKVVQPNGDVVDYVIDGLNRRVGVKLNGVLQQGFLYKDKFKPTAELDGINNVISRFVYATSGDAPDYMIKGGLTYQIICDHTSSPRLVIDTTTGVVVQRMDYDPLGRVTLDTNPGFQPFGFAGGVYDRRTGLVRLGARDYDPETGRWTQKDPLLFAGGSLSLYAYADNDPVNLIDSTGLMTKTQCRTIKRLKECEGKYGTYKCAKVFSNTIGKNWLQGFDDTSGELQCESAFGPIDLDWFTDLVAYGGQGVSTPVVLALYVSSKLTWDAVKKLDNSYNQVRLPFEDPGEVSALLGQFFGSSYSDLFPDDMVNDLCPNSVDCDDAFRKQLDEAIKNVNPIPFFL